MGDIVQLPANIALPPNVADQNAPGFKVRVVQAASSQVGFVALPASSARAEAQLAGALLDPATRQPYADVSDKTGFNADGSYDEPGVIDYDQAGNTTAFIPGLPEGEVDPDNLALEAVTYLHLTPGTYTMVVNSDDGFQLTSGADVRDWFSRTVVGVYEGGRGAEDSTFTFSVSQEGLYPFRLLWYESSGGANVSWFSGDARILVNDRANGGIPAYRAITQARPTYIRYVTPAPNSVDVSRSAPVQLQIGDGDSVQVNPSSIELFLNDTKVTPTIEKIGAVTKVTYAPAALWPAASTNRVRLVYSDTGNPPASRTQEYTFRASRFTSITLPSPIYFENFDATAEGALPAGWTETNLTDQSGSSADIDFTNLDSAAYAKWTVVNVERFRGSFVTYSNPDNDPSWENDYKRVLSFNPANIVNDQAVTNLASGRFLFGNSGYRNGSGGQILYVFTPDFDLTGRTNVYLSFHSLWEQNQDSIAAIEYSIDSGATWLPIAYFLEPADVVENEDGTVNAVETFTQQPSANDLALYTDPNTGETIGGTYGAFIAAEITEDLAPFIQARVEDDAVDSKRVELFRLERADNQAKVRFRFAHAGNDSWYFGIDDFGIYSISDSTPAPTPSLAVAIQGDALSLTWPGAAGIVLQKATSLSTPTWADVPGTAGASTFSEPISGGTAFYRLFKR